MPTASIEKILMRSPLFAADGDNRPPDQYDVNYGQAPEFTEVRKSQAVSTDLNRRAVMCWLIGPSTIEDTETKRRMVRNS